MAEYWTDGMNISDSYDMTQSDSHDYGSSNDCDYELYITFQFYAWGIMASIMVVFGIFGNIVSFRLLFHHLVWSSTSIYLISIAVYDTVLLISMCLFAALPAIYEEKGVLHDYYYARNYIVPFGYPIQRLAQTGIIYTTLVLAVNCYIAVCTPLQTSHTYTRSRPQLVIAVIFFFSLICSIPCGFEYETKESLNSYGNRMESYVKATELGRNKAYGAIYHIYLQLCSIYVFPFCFLAVLNTQLFRAYRIAAQSNRRQVAVGSAPRSSTKEPNLGAMVIAVVTVFLVCQFAEVVDYIMWTFGIYTLNCRLHYIRLLSKLALVVNSAIKIIIYCLFSLRFRRAFCQSCVPCKKQQSQYRYENIMNSRIAGGQNAHSVDDVENTLL